MQILTTFGFVVLVSLTLCIFLIYVHRSYAIAVNTVYNTLFTLQVNQR